MRRETISRRTFVIGGTQLALLGLASPAFAYADERTRQGTVTYVPPDDEETVDARFHLDKHTFDYSQKMIANATAALSMWNVTFPSPVKTEHENNNTVHTEYYLPVRDKPVPGVIVLHILGGDFQLSRLFCMSLADKGVASLFLKMPYYGPREQPGVKRRMISPDPDETVAGMTQAVLDIRRGVGFLAAQKEVDAARLGIFGISLGGITGSLALTADPRLKHACFLLAGGDLGKVAWDSRERHLEKIRTEWLARGGTEKTFREKLDCIDPIHYAKNVAGRRILMLNAKSDEVIPKVCTESLWTAFGKPEIHWYSGGHYSVGWHIADALKRVSEFFAKS